MDDHVPDDVKRDRIERLVEVVQRSAAARNAERVGRVEQVLVEGPSRTDPALVRGRTRRNTTVNFAGPAEAGTLVDVLIEGATSTTLRGTRNTVPCLWPLENETWPLTSVNDLKSRVLAAP